MHLTSGKAYVTGGCYSIFYYYSQVLSAPSITARVSMALIVPVILVAPVLLVPILGKVVVVRVNQQQ